MSSRGRTPAPGDESRRPPPSNRGRPWGSATFVSNGTRRPTVAGEDVSPNGWRRGGVPGRNSRLPPRSRFGAEFIERRRRLAGGGRGGPRSRSARGRPTRAQLGPVGAVRRATWSAASPGDGSAVARSPQQDDSREPQQLDHHDGRRPPVVGQPAARREHISCDSSWTTSKSAARPSTSTAATGSTACTRCCPPASTCRMGRLGRSPRGRSTPLEQSTSVYRVRLKGLSSRFSRTVWGVV